MFIKNNVYIKENIAILVYKIELSRLTLTALDNIINIVDSINIYWLLNHIRNFSNDTDCITTGIELCNIPQISEHCPK